MGARPNRVLISHAQVVTCSGDLTERPFDGDVLIEGDRIAGVFRGRAPVDPQSAVEVDVAGATVLPGLCDAHTHISWPLDFVFDHPEGAAMHHALLVTEGSFSVTVLGVTLPAEPGMAVYVPGGQPARLQPLPDPRQHMPEIEEV